MKVIDRMYHNFYRVDNLDEAIERINYLYSTSTICLWDLLDYIELEGFSIKEEVFIYAKLFKDIENDDVVRLLDEGAEEFLWETA